MSVYRKRIHPRAASLILDAVRRPVPRRLAARCGRSHRSERGPLARLTSSERARGPRSPQVSVEGRQKESLGVPDLFNSVRVVRRIPPGARIVVLLGLLAVVGGVGLALQRGASVSSNAPHVGTPAPEFSLNTLSGQKTSLTTFRGHPVIVNFWATWCPPCRAEMPAISSVAKAHPDTIVLAVDVLEGPALVQIYLNETPLGFAPLLDPEGRTASLYKVNSLPSSFFIGPDGTIRAINIGPMDQPTIEANLRKAL